MSLSKVHGDSWIFRPGWRAGVLAGWLAFLSAFAVTAQAHGASAGDAGLRIAFSSRMFTDVNENDAKAAVKLWGQTVARERGIVTDTETRIFHDLPSIAEGLRKRSVDAVGLLVQEYESLRHEVKFAPIFVTFSGGRIDEEYILLVHRDSGIENVGQLQGRSLSIYENPRASLAPAWLDTLLVKAGQKPAAELFGRVSPAGKLPNVVLPVFFRKVDACVVSRRGFETLVELNPQVGKQLRRSWPGSETFTPPPPASRF